MVLVVGPSSPSPGRRSGRSRRRGQIGARARARLRSSHAPPGASKPLIVVNSASALDARGSPFVKASGAAFARQATGAVHAGRRDCCTIRASLGGTYRTPAMSALKSVAPAEAGTDDAPGRTRTCDPLLRRREHVLRSTAACRSGGSGSHELRPAVALCCGLPLPKRFHRSTSALRIRCRFHADAASTRRRFRERSLVLDVRSSSVAGGSVAARVTQRGARFAGATGLPDLVLLVIRSRSGAMQSLLRVRR